MAFVLAPILTEIGLASLVSDIAVSLGLSATAGEIAGAAAVGVVAGEVASKTGLDNTLIDAATQLNPLTNEVMAPKIIVREILKTADTLAKNAADSVSVEDLIKNLPQDEEFKRVYQVYNGKTLSAENNARQTTAPSDNYFFTDELGVEVMLPKTQGLTIPTIHGSYYGPYSANNPENVKDITLVDLFSAFHDYDYSQQYFSRIGDYKYVSRLIQNFDRYSPEEAKYAKFAILYFSTLGQLINGLYGSLPDNVSQTVVPQLTVDDVYAKIGNPNDPNYVFDRTEFYNAIDNELSVSSSLMGQYSNAELIDAFGSIEIELV